MTSPRTLVLFEQVDTFSFRDARPFNAGDDPLSNSLPDPRPSTIRGALHAAVNARPGTLKGGVVGPIVASWRNDDVASVELWYPCPADLVKDGETIDRLDWTANDATRTDLDAHEDPRRRIRGPVGNGDSLPNLLVAKPVIDAYLAGDTRQAVGLAQLAYDTDVRTPWYEHGGVVRRNETHVGLALDDHKRAIDSFLYATQVRRMLAAGHRTVGYATIYDGQLPEIRRTVRLGGENRQVQVHTLPLPDDLLPLSPGEFPDDAMLLYLATPAVFEHGWRPPVDQRVALTMACMPGTEPVAGGSVGHWWIAHGTPAGSVYRLEFRPSGTVPEHLTSVGFAAANHGRCISQRQDNLRLAGFGLCFTGVLP